MAASLGNCATRTAPAAGHGLGGYPEVSGTLARKKAADLRNTISDGIDPQEQKRTIKAAIDSASTRTFRAAADDWLKAKVDKGLADSTLNKIRTYLEKDILPALGDKLLDNITRTDCAALQASIEARNAHNVAEKCRTWINQIFGRAIGLGLTENDPASRLRDIAAPASKTQQHPHLLEPELPDFLRALKTTTSRLPARTASWLCLLTASRPGMVRLAEWSEFNLDDATWTVPAAKMKMRRDHVIPPAKQLVHEVVFDSSQINEAFKDDGGLKRLDNNLGCNLDQVLEALNDNLWSATG